VLVHETPHRPARNHLATLISFDGPCAHAEHFGGVRLGDVYMTLFTTPVIYLYLDRFSQWIAWRRDRPATPVDARAAQP
jgi:hypothetical protein